MKKTLFSLLAFLIFCISAVTSGASGAEDTAISFYIRKNGHSMPVLSEELRHIYNYNCIYADEKAAACKDKVIYLTFDAGYENGNVARILDVLKEENVKGSFFILSHLIRKNADLVKRMAEEGHTVCNHTANHKDMTTLTDAEMIANLNRLETAYKECTGREMEKIFRFPEGRFNARTLKNASDNGYRTVFWSLAYADWDNERQPDPEKAKRILLDNTHDGAIILLHPTSSTNARILKDLIREWKQLGYRFGDLNEIA